MSNNLNNEKKSFEGVKAAYKAIDEKKGIDIVILDISEISVIADYFVIASASNSNQLSALADAVEEKMYKEAGLRLHHAEGLRTNSWVLLDFGDIIVHLFNKEDREFYNIERIWGDAKFVELDSLK